MKRAVLLILALLIAAPIVAASYALRSGFVEARAADAVRRATGGELIATIGYSWPLTLTATGIRIAHPGGPDLLTADSATASLEPWPLLTGRVVFDLIRVVGPDLRLQRDADGRGNWEPPPSTAAIGPAPTASAPPRRPPGLGLLRVENGHVAWRAGGPDLDVAISGLDVSGPDPAGTLRLDGIATVSRTEIEFHGTVGPTFSLGIKGEGWFATLRGPQDALAIRLTAPTLAPLALPQVQAAVLDATLTRSPGMIALTGLHATSSAGDIGGDLTLTTAPRPMLRGTLAAGRIDLAGWIVAPAPAPPAAPPSPAPPATPPPRPAALFSDRPLPFAALARADADIRLTVAELVWPGTTAALDTHATLTGGQLRLDPARLVLPGGTLDARATVNASPPAMTLDLAGPLPLTLVVPGSTGMADLDVSLTATGATPHDLATTLAGRMGVAVVNGELDNAVLAPFLRGVPVPLSGRSQIRCAALRADVTAGQGTLPALLLDTNRLLLDGDGTFDLPAEKLDLRLRPTVQLGAATIAVPVHVTGGLRTPRAQLGARDAVAPPPGPEACTAALALARNGHDGPPPADRPKPRPADLLRGLLR